VSNYLYKKTIYYKNICEFDNLLDKDKPVPHNLDIVNFGSVFGRFAFEYTEGENGYNFAMSPQSLSYDYRILKEYISHINENGVVIFVLPVCVFALLDFSDDARNAKYYSFLSKDSILGYSKWKEIKYKTFPILTSGIKWLHIIKDSKDRNYMGEQISNISEEQAKINGEERIKGWCRQFGLQDAKTAEISEDIKQCFEKNIKTLEEMIEISLQHGLRSVLVSTPFTDALNGHFSQEFVDKMLYQNIRKANKRNIPYFDYRQHPDFQRKYEWFINGCDWLTKAGREHFLELFYKDLKEYNILGDE
jgi:hypothetical protein